MSQDPAANDPVVVASSAAENIKQIRDILFGEHLRAVENRFDTLERRLQDQQQHFQAQLREQWETLQARIDQAVAELNGQLSDESRARNEAADELRKEMRHLHDEHQARASQIEADALDNVDLVKRELEDQINTAEARFSTEQARLTQDLSTRHRDLQQRKVDNAQLATLLGEMAQRLASDNPGEPDHSDS